MAKKITQSPFKWTKENEDKLASLYGKGHTAKEIAAILGAPSKNAVIGKMDRMRLSPRKKKERRARMRPAKVVPIPIQTTYKDLLSIRKNECRWPIEDRLFCACATNEGESYCETHKKMARRKL